ARGEAGDLSAEAKLRLKILDYYYRSSAQFSRSGKPDAVLTCRHFGIHRPLFCRWKARSDKTRLSSLENRPAAPKKKRQPEYSRDLVRAVREIRKEDPAYERSGSSHCVLSFKLKRENRF
ncbi:MAG: hypothetical protein LBT00_03260, partial [Spirochaetaceae bacterium]|nr:hypothetical protein [Spirochaetaceae bacterium]